MRAVVILLAVWAGGCSTEVNAIEDTKPCAEGAFHSDGSPILLGEACYDEWIVQVADELNAIHAAIDKVLPHCIALAEARGLPDTWSALETTVAKATAACASLGGIELAPEWGCELSADACNFSFMCSTSMPPVWLDELAATLPAMGALCCELEKRIDALTPLLLSPPCEQQAPGVGQCMVQLVPWISYFMSDSVTLCGGAQVPLEIE